MVRSELAIVIPAYNEELSIAKVVENLLSEGSVIVVNDCSEDNTEEEAKKAGAIVINHKINLGYDSALNSGFQYASQHSFRYAITFDADGQHDDKVIKCFKLNLDNGHRLVLGSRQNRARISEYLFGLLTNLLYKVPDPLCGLKGYNMSLYSSLGHFDSYKSIGTELMLYALKSKATKCLVKITVKDREIGKSRFGNILKGNYMILRAMFLGISKYLLT